MGVVYCIRHKESGKTYVGSSISGSRRKVKHFSDLRCGRHFNQYLQRAFDKYGELCFEWQVLEEVVLNEQLALREKHWIVELEATNRKKGYNATDEPFAPMRGKKHTEESRKKMSTTRINGNTASAKITKEQALTVFQLYSQGFTQKQIGHQLGIHFTNVSLILRGKSWVNLKQNTFENRTNNRSGFPGVYQPKNSSKWVAEIWRGKYIRLGTFLTKEEAVSARKEAERNYDGV